MNAKKLATIVTLSPAQKAWITRRAAANQNTEVALSPAQKAWITRRAQTAARSAAAHKAHATRNEVAQLVAFIRIVAAK